MHISQWVLVDGADEGGADGMMPRGGDAQAAQTAMWAMMALSVAQSQSHKFGAIDRLTNSHAQVGGVIANVRGGVGFA